MQGKTAVIGDYDSVLLFRAGGVDVFSVSSCDEAKATLKKIAKDYSVIFISASYASGMQDYLKRFLENAFPVIVEIPDKNTDSDYVKNKLQEQMKRALGVDILYRDEKKGDK